jgi:rhodanese-related sulfurtransferase
VHAGVPGAEELLAVVGIVVLASTALHGASATPASAWYARRISGKVHEEERESDAAGIFGGDEEVIPRISVEELNEHLQSHQPPLILDVRSRMSYEHDKSRIPGDIRIPPDRIAEWARTVPEGLSVVAYCT